MFIELINILPCLIQSKTRLIKSASFSPILPEFTCAMQRRPPLSARVVIDIALVRAGQHLFNKK